MYRVNVYATYSLLSAELPKCIYYNITGVLRRHNYDSSVYDLVPLKNKYYLYTYVF
jgi:hypothetical protein